MNERTKHAYGYRHDGGDYIGCRHFSQCANGYDCIHNKWSDVDCTDCKLLKGDADEDSLSGH
jgi:hypothetical protein